MTNALHSDKLLTELKLPRQMPWLGREEMGFIGNGLIGCGMDTRGVWYSLNGTSYSQEPFLKKNRLKAIINGKPYTLKGEMHRAAGTGIYYSIQRFKDVVVYVVDFAVMHRPYITRLVAAHNMSGTPVEFNPYVEIKRPAHIRCHEDMKTQPDGQRALTLVRPDSRLMTVKFAGQKTAVRVYDEETEIILDTGRRTLKPDETCIFSLYHHAHADSQSTGGIIKEIDSRDGLADLHECLAEWSQWLKKGKDLSFIPDAQARDILESSRIIIRMEQGDCGGIMATPAAHTSSYIRDNHSSLRGMMAAGHMDEARRYLLYVNDQFQKLVARGDFGIPTSLPIGVDQPPFFGFGNAENWSCETPGLYVLTAKRYYELTRDTATMKMLEAGFRYAIKVQLDFARAHDWKLIFNGDETESGGCGITMFDSITEKRRMYSMSAQVICIASLEFFIDYLSLSGQADEASGYRQDLARLKQSLDENFWNEELGVYDWFRTLDGGRPKTMMCNFQIMPLYFGNITTPERAARSARAMKQYIPESGFIPNQPLSENMDFCGHNMGYLLYAMTTLKDPIKEQVYQNLVHGGMVGCWGMWGEAYFDDLTPYGFGQTWDNRPHNLRPFETGTNMEAIIQYWEASQGA